MAKTKNYKEELEGLEAGLRKLDNMKPRKYNTYERIRHARDIQEARIQFFKMGYSLRNREIMEQNGLLLKKEIEKVLNSKDATLDEYEDCIISVSGDRGNGMSECGYGFYLEAKK